MRCSPGVLLAARGPIQDVLSPPDRDGAADERARLRSGMAVGRQPVPGRREVRKGHRLHLPGQLPAGVAGGSPTPAAVQLGGADPEAERALELSGGERVGLLGGGVPAGIRSEEHTSELQSHSDLVCRLLLEKKNDQDVARRVGLVRGAATVPNHTACDTLATRYA